jgi:hypothetical protein
MTDMTIMAKPTKDKLKEVAGKSAVEVGKAVLLSDEETGNAANVSQRTGNDSSIYQTQSALDFCKACWCNKQDSIDCQRPNVLKSIPVLRDKNFREQITEITIENQKDFKSLEKGGLKFYPNIEKL